MIFSLLEIFYILITIGAIGFIFAGMIPTPQKDPLLRKRFDWDEIKLAIYAVAPGVILHELFHKFVAMGFGFNAIYEIWPTGLVIGIVLKLVNAGFILLAPGYVTFAGASPLQSSLIAFAGPAANLLFWIAASLLLKQKHLSRKVAIILTVMKESNKWLFIFNMIPIPPLDGYKVFSGIFGNFF